jgi:hypothetical protein
MGLAGSTTNPMNPHRGYVELEGNNQGMDVFAQIVAVVNAQGAVCRNESFNVSRSSG